MGTGRSKVATRAMLCHSHTIASGFEGMNEETGFCARDPAAPTCDKQRKPGGGSQLGRDFTMTPQHETRQFRYRPASLVAFLAIVAQRCRPARRKISPSDGGFFLEKADCQYHQWLGGRRRRAGGKPRRSRQLAGEPIGPGFLDHGDLMRRSGPRHAAFRRSGLHGQALLRHDRSRRSATRCRRFRRARACALRDRSGG